jgi:hypothetical protein
MACLKQDFMECAGTTPTFFDSSITPIQNNKMQPTSSFPLVIEETDKYKQLTVIMPTHTINKFYAL